MTGIWEPRVDFTAAPTVWHFLQSLARFRIIVGPFGSGKTVGCCVAPHMHVLRQMPNPDGWRLFKLAVVRNTKPELKSTTMATWDAMYPADKVGSSIVYGSPYSHRIRTPPDHFEWVRPPEFVPKDTADGVVWTCVDAGAYRGDPGIDLQVEFLGLDDASDAKKLLSWEGSMFYFNELSEIRKPVVDLADLRHGRYPSMENGGVPCTWSGMIADTNEPDDLHWLHEVEEEARADPSANAIQVFRQPPALLDSSASEAGSFNHRGHYYRLNREAENLLNLPPGYYSQRLAGKETPWIQRFYQGKRVFMQAGRPCVPGFDDSRMSIKFDLIKNSPLLFGYDIGSGTLWPACVICQRHPRGPLLVHAEICGENIGTDNFVYLIHQLGETLWPERWSHLISPSAGARGWADPSGNTGDEIFNVAISEYIRSKNLPCLAAPTNAIDARIEVVQQATERNIGGMPGLLVHDRCTKLRAGLAGRWYYRVHTVSGESISHSAPVKNEFSHPCDALGYIALGAGGWRAIQGRRRPTGQPATGRVQVDPYEVLRG